ncbi:MAG TPA: alkaline phosphatase family protein [Tepidisphaeraceae bacterium]|nr:alkaline phosphatase family protein [Tepidisphaeraceae bacterium]
MLSPPTAAASAEHVLTHTELVYPDYSKPDLVDLVRAMGILCGVQDFQPTPPQRHLIDLIGPADHYVFVLLDGLGMNLVRRPPENMFLRRRLRAELRSTVPSTTASALTSVATGVWPATHGVTGWFSYIPERELSLINLPFVERFSGEWLVRRGITAEQIFPVPSFYPRMKYRPLTLNPTIITNTTYARYSRGDTPALPYTSIAHAVDQVIAASTQPTGLCYTHVYIPDVDARIHHRGLSDASVGELIGQIDRELARLADGLDGRARMVITADHGLIEVPVRHHLSLWHDDPMMNLLQAPPSGDARLPIFHVRPGKDAEFVRRFTESFGHAMMLLPTEQAEQLCLFGPEPIASNVRRRFGDYVGIAYRNYTLHYVLPADPNAAPRAVYVAQHAGLSRDEMQIPLILA